MLKIRSKVLDDSVRIVFSRWPTGGPCYQTFVKILPMLRTSGEARTRQMNLDGYRNRNFVG